MNILIDNLFMPGLPPDLENLENLEKALNFERGLENLEN